MQPEPFRAVRFGDGIRRRKSGEQHIVQSKGPSAAWTYCGKMLTAAEAELVRDMPWDHPAVCKSCRHAELNERRTKKPGWWKTW